MKKKIPVQELQVGMYVTGLDQSWFNTPFPVHSFLIASTEDIERLKHIGIRTVEIDLEKSVVRHHPQFQAFSLPTPRKGTSSGTLPSADIEALRSLQTATLQRLHMAFKDARFGKPFRIYPFQKTLQSLTELALSNPSVGAILLENDNFENDILTHSVNTMTLALGIACHKKLPPGECILWGLSALFHDIGKCRIPETILDKPSSLSDEERKVVEEHTFHGFKILHQSPDASLRNIVARVALEHHEREGGKGYPYGMTCDQLQPLSRLIATLDVYESLTGDRSYSAGIPSSRALSYLVDTSRSDVDHRAAMDLVYFLGEYPVGTLFVSPNGQVHLVAGYPNPENPKEVITLVIAGEDGELLDSPEFQSPLVLEKEFVRSICHPRNFGLSQADMDHWIGRAGEKWMEETRTVST